jgi:hypothetical protein
MPGQAASGEQPVPEVDDLLGFEPDVLHRLDYGLPNVDVALVAAMDTEQVGWDHTPRLRFPGIGTRSPDQC